MTDPEFRCCQFLRDQARWCCSPALSGQKKLDINTAGFIGDVRRVWYAPKTCGAIWYCPSVTVSVPTVPETAPRRYSSSNGVLDKFSEGDLLYFGTD